MNIDSKPAAAPRPAGVPFPKVKPAVVGVEQVTVQCGHAVPFELFDPKKDKFRDARRKKLTDRPCSACRIKAQEARQAVEKEAARQKRLAKAKNAAVAASDPRNRLPDGSRFDVAYDASKGQWSGTLAVPGLAPISAAASGVFKLLMNLDRLYRKAAAPEAEADPNRDVGGEG